MSKKFKPCIHNVISSEKNFVQWYGILCCLLAVLGSHGIVVKCTAAIFSVRWFAYLKLDVKDE